MKIGIKLRMLLPINSGEVSIKIVVLFKTKHCNPLVNTLLH